VARNALGKQVIDPGTHVLASSAEKISGLLVSPCERFGAFRDFTKLSNHAAAPRCRGAPPWVFQRAAGLVEIPSAPPRFIPDMNARFQV